MKTPPRDQQSALARLPKPLAKVLVDPVAEQSVPRMWKFIELSRSAQSSRARPWLIVVAAVTALGLLTAIVTRSLRPNVQAAAPIAAMGTLASAVEVPSDASARRVVLGDGSVIIAQPAARLEPTAATAARFALRLERGAAAFEVRPNPGRRFEVYAGDVRVEVVGTRFTVERSADAVRVRVERGTVLVHAAHLVSGVTRLEAGQALDVSDTPAASAAEASVALETSKNSAEAPRDRALAKQPAAGPSASSTAPSAPSSAREIVAWRQQANQGDHAQAYAELAQRGFALETARARDPEALFALSDVARLSGHPEQARAPLSRLLQEFPNSSRAGLAAITLGRVDLELGRPSDAAKDFELALTLGLPSALVEDTAARVVESYVRAGNRLAAERAATQYRQRFPHGRRAEDVSRWLETLADPPKPPLR